MNKINSSKRPIKKIQQEILHILIILITIMTILITSISILVNIKSDSRSIDQNLQNIAQTLASSKYVENAVSNDDNIHKDEVMFYLNSLQGSLTNIDVISIINSNQIRVYHTNPELIGTVYDGTMPQFLQEDYGYVTNDIGPSGSQRRAYAAIYDENGNYLGFVLAVMLNQHIHHIIFTTILIHLLCSLIIIIVAVVLSNHLSKRIKNLLLGYEPDTFSAMFSVRENILESLEEGIIALGTDKKVIYINNAAKNMLHIPPELSGGYFIEDIVPDMIINPELFSGEKIFGLSMRLSQGNDIIADLIPVMEHDLVSGALCILRDRTEYTKMMEDLSGVRYMVESMRANNHDFVNKLHVILGLIQMGNTKEASEYITNITTIQQSVINNIIKNIEDSSVAALLIGKYSRASELNIQFKIKSGSHFSKSDIAIPSGDLVTIIGNLIDNAMDSMNEKDEPPKDLTVGIFTKPHALLISVDDTGMGIPPEKQDKIYENGFSTKGEGRGTGLYVTKNLITKYGGTISVESEQGFGTFFTASVTDNCVKFL